VSIFSKKPKPQHINRHRFSQQLQDWLDSDSQKTVASLQLVFQQKIFAVAFVVLMSVAALPIPTGGITHVFEVITMLLALELCINRKTLWLPQKWLHLKFGQKFLTKIVPFLLNKIHWLETKSAPRGTRFFNFRYVDVIFGLNIIVFALAAFLAPPFSLLDTLPAWGILLVSLGFILEDIYFVFAGWFFGILGIVLQVLFAAVIITAVKHFIDLLKNTIFG
jgi:hypothetical protein